MHKNINDIKNIYLLGIGGIGMSALARYFKSIGKKVSGYDKTETPLTKQLVAEGIPVNYNDDENLLDKNADVVIYTPAIPQANKQFEYYRNNGYDVMKRSQVLGLLAQNAYSICVAGTHGKTTTSSMVTHIFVTAGIGTTAFLGGITVNYQSNYIHTGNEVVVVEADEYDRSFLQLHPNMAIITSMDADHLDIYGTEAAMHDAYIQFSKQIKPQGSLFVQAHVQNYNQLSATYKYKYAVEETGVDVNATNIKLTDGAFVFDVVFPNKTIKDFTLYMGGMHNLENAVAAIAVADKYGINEADIKKAIATYRGVSRRFEYIVKNPDFVFIDDYGHHPQELEALLQGVKKHYPNTPITIVFQPHLYSRTKDHYKGFAEVLQNNANRIFLLPIYPARELPMEGVSSEMIANEMPNSSVQVVSKAELKQMLKELQNAGELPLLVTAGAGDIDMELPELKILLTKK